MGAPSSEPFSACIHYFVHFTARIQIVFQWDGAFGSANDIDIFLFCASFQAHASMELDGQEVSCGEDGKEFMTYPTHSANSFVFGTVALRRMILTWSGSIMITSSHTTPLYPAIKSHC